MSVHFITIRTQRPWAWFRQSSLDWIG